MEICVHILPLFTPSVHHSGRSEGRLGVELFGPNIKVLPGDTLRGGGGVTEALLGTRQ